MVINRKVKKGGGMSKSPSKSGSPSKSSGKSLAKQEKTSPMNITKMAEDLQIKILESVIKFSDILDNKSINEYIKLRFNIPQINRSFRKSYSSVIASFKEITKIKLNKLMIDKEILGVLKMTNAKNIESIELRDISFDSKETCNEFIDFFSKNRGVKRVILDKVEVKIDEMLRILETFKGLEWLEIKGYELTYDEFHTFIKVLLYSKQLKYLTFKENIIDKRYYTYLFTKDVENYVYIYNVKYNIYISNENNKRWGMIIRSMEGNIERELEVNIVGNDVNGEYGVYRNFRNDFGGV